MSIQQEFIDIEKTMTGAAQSASSPVFVHMLGIPGSGKSSFLNILHQTWNNTSSLPATLLGFDQVMQSLPSYQAMADKVAGFDMFELPAREAGYRILNGLIQKRVHILFDNGGSAQSHPDLLQAARDNYGYRLIFVSVKTPLSIARQRVDVRAVQAGQHTPLHYLEERQAKLDALIPAYRALTPHFYELENSGENREAFHRDCERLAAEISVFKD